MAEPSVCVIVCVHNALPDVRQCLASLKATDYAADRFRLVIVDDGSDHETKCLLQDFAESDNTTLIRHSVARGYTMAANAGIQARGDAAYVVLLNSDAIVPPQWLRRMLTIFDSLPDVGIVGPLSNAATWQSVPDVRNDAGGWAANDLPPNWSIQRMDELVHSLFAAAPRTPRVPVLNGFCLMIRSDVFDRIGLFDERRFPKGYGEENDFCFRTTDAGFGLAVAMNCYVFHAKSKSFGTATRDELARSGREQLKKKYGAGRLSRASETMKRQPVLADMRAKITRALQRDQLLAGAISHTSGDDPGPLGAPALAGNLSKAREVNAAVQRAFEDGATGLHEIDGNFALDVLEPASFKDHQHIRGSYPEGQPIEEGFATGPVFALRALDAEIDASAGLTLVDGGVIRCTAVTGKLVKRYGAPSPSYRAMRHEGASMIAPVGSLRMGNYCRWWLESVAKSFVVSRSMLASDKDGSPISLQALTPELPARFQRDTVDLLDGTFDFVPAESGLTRGLCINSSGLCYGGAQQVGAMAQDLSAFLGDIVLPEAEGMGAGPLVYVSRNRSNTRRVRNEDEFLPALRALGFTILELEDLPLASQIEMFRNARVVVSPHGAALANILFCRPEAKVVEIFPEGGVHGSAYLRIASHLSLDYYFVVASTTEHASEAKSPVDADMTVDGDALVGFLSEVVNARS